MNIQTPVEKIDNHFLNRKIAAKAKEWDIESTLLEFEQALDTLDIISDGLPDDPRVSNALNGIHDKLSSVHSGLSARLLKVL